MRDIVVYMGLMNVSAQLLFMMCIVQTFLAFQLCVYDLSDCMQMPTCTNKTTVQLQIVSKIQ